MKCVHKIGEKEHIAILLVFKILFRQEIKFQMFRVFEGIKIFKMGRDIVQEDSGFLSNCLFTGIGRHF